MVEKHIRDARCFLHLQMIRESYGEYLNVFQAEIPRAIRIAETSAYGQSIYEYDPKGKAVEAFEGLVGEGIKVGVLRLQSTPFSLNYFWEYSQLGVIPLFKLRCIHRFRARRLLAH